MDNESDVRRGKSKILKQIMLTGPDSYPAENFGLGEQKPIRARHCRIHPVRDKCQLTAKVRC